MPINQTDEELMLKAGKGDMSAFNFLVNKHKKYLLNLCYGYIPSAEQAEDIAQETFLRVYKNAKKYKPTAKFTTWLSRIAINLCFDILRQNKRKKTESLFDAESGNVKSKAEHTVDNSIGPEEDVEAKEIADSIQEAVKMLPEDQRSVVVMAFFNKTPYEEIAETLNISVGSVKMRINRARLVLKDILSKKKL